MKIIIITMLIIIALFSCYDTQEKTSQTQTQKAKEQQAQTQQTSKTLDLEKYKIFYDPYKTFEKWETLPRFYGDCTFNIQTHPKFQIVFEYGNKIKIIDLDKELGADAEMWKSLLEAAFNRWSLSSDDVYVAENKYLIMVTVDSSFNENFGVIAKIQKAIVKMFKIW